MVITELNLTGETNGLMKGIEILGEKLGFRIAESGLKVKVEKVSENIIEINFNNGICCIKYKEKIHFFRALGILLENLKHTGKFILVEKPQFRLDGVMFDVSRNAVMNTGTIKDILEMMALMGLNMMMLYTEDTYTIEDEPFFGYMRGRYSHDELKEIDDYADIFGIEIIPCIQTLAHLERFLRWNVTSDIRDTSDILLAGDPKTYELIEKMIKAISNPLRSKRIHIGMDEAHGLGLGRYLNLNGYKKRFDIMNDHLNKVVDIASGLGLKPMMWSDMYFRLGSKDGEYYDLEAEIPESVIESIPKGVQMIYWDYYHKDEEFYSEYIKRHEKFGSKPVFAGGIWTWNGYGTNYGKSLANSEAALRACKKEGVGEVFVALWGDCGAESNYYGSLLGLQFWAEHGYDPKPGMDKIIRRFEFCTGAEYDAYLDLKYLDETPGTDKGNNNNSNPSKFLLWQDILTGLFDKNIEGIDFKSHYTQLQAKMVKHVEQNRKFAFVFQVPEKLCSVLQIKSDIGIRIKKYYDSSNLKGLKDVAEIELPELIQRINSLKSTHRKQWFKTYKPFGWEVIDIRYGGLVARIETSIIRLKDYVEGNIDKIEELDEEKLYFGGNSSCEIDASIGFCDKYRMIVTANGFE